MTLQQKREALRLARIKEYQFDETKLDRVTLNRAQKPFVESDKRITAFLAANKIGKCNSIRSLIETPMGSMKIGEIFGTACEVLTWPDKNSRRVLAWVKKPKEECFHINFSDGKWIEVTKGHRLLTSEGWLSVGAIFCRLPTSVFYRPQSTSALARLTRALGVQDCWRNIQDYLGGCLIDSRLGDAQLLSDEDGVQVFAPLPSDAPKRNRLWSCMDGLVSRGRRSLYELLCHLSSSCASLLTSGPSAWRLSPSPAYDDRCTSEYTLRDWQSSITECPEKPSLGSSDYQCDDNLALNLREGVNRIVSVYSIGVKEIYDMQVEERQNYISGGIAHHNTTAGVIKMLRFVKPGGKVFRVIGSLGFEKGIRDIILPEIKKWLPKSMLIKEKPNSQGITTKMYLRGDNGQDSIISFMSAEQDPMTFEGDLIDGAWIDEPCPHNIYTATLRGLIVSSGPLFFTLTPLSEPWIYNEIFLSQDKDIQCFQGSMEDALIEHGGHLTHEQVDSFASKIPEDERPARIFGQFKHLLGRVYKSFDPLKHVVEPFAIPFDWPVWCAIDPHQRKPNTALWLAISPQGNWYVCNEVRMQCGIEDFGREVLNVSKQYNVVCHLIDTSSETPDWNKRDTARSILERVGLRTRLARKKNLKAPARMMIQQALEGKDGTGKPWLYVFNFCKRTQFEFLNHVWDDNKRPETQGIKEEVKKINDDLLDPLAYIVVEKPSYKKPQVIDRIFNGQIKESNRSVYHQLQ